MTWQELLCELATPGYDEKIHLKVVAQGIPLQYRFCASSPQEKKQEKQSATKR